MRSLKLFRDIISMINFTHIARVQRGSCIFLALWLIYSDYILVLMELFIVSHLCSVQEYRLASYRYYDVASAMAALSTYVCIRNSEANFSLRHMVVPHCTELPL